MAQQIILSDATQAIEVNVASDNPVLGALDVSVAAILNAINALDAIRDTASVLFEAFVSPPYTHKLTFTLVDARTVVYSFSNVTVAGQEYDLDLSASVAASILTRMDLIKNAILSLNSTHAGSVEWNAV